MPAVCTIACNKLVFIDYWQKCNDVRETDIFCHLSKYYRKLMIET